MPKKALSEKETELVRLVGERLQFAIAFKETTKNAVAEKADILPQTLNNIVTGKGDTSFSKLAKISQVLDIPLDYFVTETTEKRNAYLRIESESNIPSIWQLLRKLKLDEKRVLFQALLPTLIIDLEDELGTPFNYRTKLKSE
jgi:transcriptional regulator with XRE-family HTH domain